MRLHKNTPEYILTGLPSVGVERAKALLDVYHNVLNVAMADANALSRIEGIGKVTARKIYEAFRENGIHQIMSQ
jgi:ERCC4-type nuclease